MTDAPASLPERLADAEGELPEKIAGPLEKLINAIGYAASGDGMFIEDSSCEEARAVLTAAILARLTAAESAREAANFMAESWKATAEAEAEIGNERAAEARAALARAERAERFIDFVLKWRDRGPPHGDAETAWSVVSHHPAVGQRARDLATLAHPATAEET